jgi:hypothetical protein
VRARPRSVRVLLVAAVTAAAGLTAALSPAGAATGPKPVTGGAVQAWQAAYYRPPKPVKIPTVTYFLTGGSNDDLARVAGTPTATFGRSKPTGGTDSSQTTTPATTQGTSSDPGTALWSAPYKGWISGRLTFTWWWATLDAASGLGGANANLRVYADPGTPQQKLIGSNGVAISAFGSDPQKVTSVVDVKGVVAKALLIQLDPQYVDASQDLRVYYGSAAHPSSFTVPVGIAGPVPVPSTTAVRDTDPLVLASSYLGRKAAEPTIGITKQGNAFMVAADFDGLSPATPQTKIFATYDGNKSWKDVSPVVAGRSFPPTTLDPYLYVDPQTGRIFSDDLTVGCSVLQWSDDQGKTWSRGNPFACEMPVDDHQTIVAGDPPPGVQTVGYPNVIYYCVNKVGDSQCARSLDGGTTFTATGNPAFAGVQPAQDGSSSAAPGFCGGLHGHIVTDPAGRLFLPRGYCGKPWLAMSEDGGTTWTQSQVSRLDIAGNQASVASDTAGNIYYLWWTADTLLPYLAVSRDHGKTFGPALLVGPPGLRAVNLPSIDAGAPGHVAISYPGTMDADASKPARAWNYYVAVSTNALADLPVFHSATANPLRDPIHRGVCLNRCAGMYDFLDVVIAPSGQTWAAAVDTCTKACSSAVGPTLGKGETATDAQGVGIRQLAGPGLPRR